MLDCRRTRRQPRRENGAVAVEFALVLPVLVMLLLGITTAGLSYSRAVGLTNAVREGARLGATTDATTGSTWANAVIDRIRSTQFDDGLTAATSSTSVCVQLWKGDAATGTAKVTTTCSLGAKDGPVTTTLSTAVSDLTVPAVSGGSCVVRVAAARKFTINIGLAKWDRTNMSTSVARYERFDKVADCA